MKIISFIFGLTLFGSIVWMGYYSTIDQHFVVWFGVYTAIFSPLAFELVAYPFRAKDNGILHKLSKVADMETLIRKADDTETKLRLLEAQRRDLDKLITYESKRKSLLAERDIYALQAEEALKNLNRINGGLTQLTGEKQEIPAHLEPLSTMIENNDNIIIRFNSQPHVFRRSNFSWFPLYGELLFDILKAMERAINRLDPPKR